MALALFAIALATVGCGGGGDGRSGPLPGAGSVSPSSAKQAVTFKIVIPKGKSSKPAVRRPRYVSPATTQLLIDVQTGCPGSCTSVSGYPTTVSLTPTTNGCSSTLASTACQLTLQLAPGNYTLTLTTEDAQNQALSTAQNVAFGVVAGANNALSLTLSGIPTEILATVFSATSDTILVQALDADGNPITGPGAPTFSVTHASGIAVDLVQPTTASPNLFAAMPAATGYATLNVTASYPAPGATNACTLAGAVCSTTLGLTSSDPVTNLFVANSANNTIEEFAPPYTGTPIASISTGLSGPASIAFNSVGNMFVANSVNYSLSGPIFAQGNFTEYAPPYSGAPLAMVSTRGDLYLAFDAGDDLFESGQTEVLEAKPPYTGSPTIIFSAPFSQIETGAGVALDSTGDLFVADNSAGYVYEYAPPYTGSPKAKTSEDAGLQAPAGLALDSSGDLFVADDDDGFPGGASVFEFEPPYSTPKAQITGASSELNDSVDLALDPAGKLYVSNYGNSTITVYAPPITSSSTPTTTLNTSLDGPTGLAFHTTYSIALGP